MTARIVEVSSVDCELIEARWDFAHDRAEEIERHWQVRLSSNPHLYNGPVLLLHRGDVDTAPDGKTLFRGACFHADFKTFMAWREFGYPPSNARNIFSMAALQANDGAFLLGEMAPHTAPAGQIYFPSGTPDPGDIKGERVDIEGSAGRELREETGLTAADVRFGAGMTLVLDDVRVCCMKPVQVDMPADALAASIHGWLALDRQPELTRMHIVRTRDDIVPAMPDFVRIYLEHRFASIA